MASVSLYQTWVTLLSTGESIHAYTARGRSHDAESDGEVRRLAGGRFRAIGTLGVRQTQEFALRDVSPEDKDILKSWIGQTVLIRDNRSRKMFGVYWSIKYSDTLNPNYYDISLSVTEVSYQEGS